MSQVLEIPSVTVKVGPADRGKRMSLAAFDRAEAQEGFVYELSYGVIEVSDIPSLEHARIEEFVRDEFVVFRRANPDKVAAVLHGSSAKTMIFEIETERHPDLSVYLTPAPYGGQPWKDWVPEIVFEIVSPFSVGRDYVTKADDYWLAGVKEYVIVDRAEGRFRVLRRGVESWVPRNLTGSELYSSPLLPGFELSVEKTFVSVVPAPR